MDDCSEPEEVEDEFSCLAGLGQTCDEDYLQQIAPKPATQPNKKLVPQPEEKPVIEPPPVSAPESIPTEAVPVIPIEHLPIIPIEPIFIPRGIEHGQIIRVS